MPRLRRDDLRGIAFVTAPAGILTESDVKAHFARVQAAAIEQRRRFGRFRCLLDQRAAIVQPQAVIDQMHGLIVTIFREGDLVAMVCDSTLLKLQLRRIEGPATYRHFDAIDEAENWLQAQP